MAYFLNNLLDFKSLFFQESMGKGKSDKAFLALFKQCFINVTNKMNEFSPILILSKISYHLSPFSNLIFTFLHNQQQGHPYGGSHVYIWAIGRELQMWRFLRRLAVTLKLVRFEVISVKTKSENWQSDVVSVNTPKILLLHEQNL